MISKKIIAAGFIILFLIGSYILFNPLQLLYLRSNAIPITLGDDNFEDFDKFSNKFSNYDIIISGEAHATQSSVKFKQNLFYYLRTQHQVTTYVEEAGLGYTYLATKFFETGNDTYLSYLMDASRGLSIYSQEIHNYLNVLRNLFISHNFSYYGLDLEHQLDLTIYAIYSIIQEYNVNITSIVFDELKDMSNYFISEGFDSSIYLDTTGNRIRSVLELLNSTISLNMEEYSQQMGNDFPVFAKMIENGLIQFTFSGLYNQNNVEEAVKLREDTIYHNFLYLSNNITSPGEKYYGQWGLSHTLQERIEDELYFKNSFVADIIDYTDLDVLSIVPYYVDSYQLLNGEESKIHNSPPFTKIRLTGVISDTEFAMIDLGNSNSPYLDSNPLIMTDNDHTTYDYFQVLLLVRNSATVTVFDPSD